jgi:hypothetical protein
MRERILTFVEKLAPHLHPRTGPKVFCMLEAYMDESGIHEGAHVCVVAGYWGTKKKWKRLEQRWLEILKEADEPTLKEFHSSEFWNSKGQRRGLFAAWSDTKADKFIADLVACIVDSRLFPTSAALVTSEWKRRTKEERMFLSGGTYDRATNHWVTFGAPNRVYFLPFHVALSNPAITCQPGHHIHYFFDLNKQFKKHALDLFHHVKNDKKSNFRHRMGSIDFPTSEEAPGLQAADLLAYQTYKSAKERIGRLTPMEMEELSPIFRKLVSNSNGQYQFPFLDDIGINRALQNIPPHLRGPAWRQVPVEFRD